MNLSQEERTRYSRHLLLPEFGAAGQEKLAKSRVLIVGVGGLGSPVALYLAAAGVGHLGLIDFDTVDTSNLQRQILFRSHDVGLLKAEQAAKTLRELNPHIAIKAYLERFSAQNAVELLSNYDLVVDGSDNFQTRYLVSDAATITGKHYVYGSIFRFEGQASVFDPVKGPCYRCLFPAAPTADMAPNCAEAGVLGVLPGFIGVIQATEVLKILAGIGTTLTGRLLTYDALSMSFGDFKITRSPNCKYCGPNRDTSIVLQKEAAACATFNIEDELTPTQLTELLANNAPLQLVDVRSAEEIAICPFPGAISLPIAALGQNLDKLLRDVTIVFICKSGVRSQRAVSLAKQSGITTAKSLSGGVNSWRRDVDSSLPIY